MSIIIEPHAGSMEADVETNSMGDNLGWKATTSLATDGPPFTVGSAHLR